ncbi:MAG: hypothetical protein WCE21_05785 [Candidatus Babeliales bacterium]
MTHKKLFVLLFLGAFASVNCGTPNNTTQPPEGSANFDHLFANWQPMSEPYGHYLASTHPSPVYLDLGSWFEGIHHTSTATDFDHLYSHIQRVGSKIENLLKLDDLSGLEKDSPLLDYQLYNSFPNKLPLLLEKKANPNVQGCVGNVPLAEAINANNREAVIMLLKAGANPNVVHKSIFKTTTPLIKTIDLGMIILFNSEKSSLVAALLRYGADPLINNSVGQNALAIMKENYTDIQPQKRHAEYKKIARVFVQYAGVKRALSGEFIDQQMRLPAEIIAMIMPFVGINLASELEANT